MKKTYSIFFFSIFITLQVTAQQKYNTLKQSYNRSVCGLNYAVDSWKVTPRSAIAGTPKGLGLPANFNFTKLPSNACFKIDTAFVWWIVSYDSWGDPEYDAWSGTPKSSSTPILHLKNNTTGDTASFSGVLIGEDGDKNWWEVGTRTFRAGVSKALITGNGSYTLNITGNRKYETDGFLLMVVYRDPSASYQGTLILNDGCITRSPSNSTCGWSTTDTLKWAGACDNSTNANAFMLTSDIQQDVNITFNATLNGKTVMDTAKFFNYTSTSTSVTKGQNISILGTDSIKNAKSCEYYTLALTGLYYQTTTCVTCTPDTSTSFVVSSVSTPAKCGKNNGTATVTVDTSKGGKAPFTYLWNNGQTTRTATGLAPGWHKVTVKDDACKATIDSVLVGSVGEVKLAIPTKTDVTCFGGSNGTAVASTTKGKYPFSYTWNTNPVQSTANASNLKAATYMVMVTDDDGCKDSTTVTISQPNDLVLTTKADSAYCGQSNGTATVTVVSGGTSPYSYSWTTTPVQTTATATGLKANTYTVSVKYPASAVCHKDTTVTVPNAGGFSATYSKTNILCFGDSTGTAKVISLGGKKPYKYSWSNGGIDSVANKLKVGTYSVTTTDANQCSVNIPAITISQPTALVVLASDTSICISKSATIRVSASGGTPAYTYSWSNTITIPTQTVTPDSTTNYIITVTDSNKCKKTDTATVKVTQPPVANVTSSGAIDLCTNDSVTLTITAPGATSYSWNTGETTASITVRPNTTTIYKATAATNNCLGIESSFTVNVSTTKVTSAFSATPVKGPVPLTVNFTNKSINGKDYIWIFGDNSGESNLSEPPSHTFDSAGKFTVLLITIEGNCRDTSSVIIEVIPVSSLFVPNVFTPNVDMKNDKFFPEKQNMASLKATIYNRWGEKVYEWDGVDGSWDGKTTGGSLSSDGVYYYIIEAKGLDEKLYLEKGFVTLIRARE